jgi:hypothetical protein
MSTAPRVEPLTLSDAVNRISVSPTMAVLMAAEKLRASGVDVVDFGPGEPDFPTPNTQPPRESRRCARPFAIGTR